jgi:hypothetical protein
MFSWRCFPFVESAPRAYRLKASNAAPLSSTSAGTLPLAAPELVAHHFTQAGLAEAAIEWWAKPDSDHLRTSLINLSA